MAEAVGILIRHRPDDVRMGLTGQHQLSGVEAQSICQDADVGFHIFHGVPPAMGQIQTRLAAHAHTPMPGGEAMGDGDSLSNQIF